MIKQLYLLFPFLLIACTESPLIKRENIPVLHAVAETDPVANGGDAADDPAIWVHPTTSERSLILGTNKKKGLAVYNLAGKQVQFLARGQLNNVDIRLDIPLNGNIVNLAVATNRTQKTLDIFQISDTGQVRFLQAVSLGLEDPYGVCMHLDGDGSAFVFTNGKNGEFQQWLLNPGHSFSPKQVGTFSIDSQPEGCVVDDMTGTLYFGEEQRGVWTMPANARRANARVLMDEISRGHLKADVEGMDIYRPTPDIAYLVVSSQGDHSYAVYNLSDSHRYMGSFRIDDRPDGTVDGVEETDGLAVTAMPLGNVFPRGMLVTQDGYNRKPTKNQNFKLIPWGDVESALGLK